MSLINDPDRLFSVLAKLPDGLTVDITTQSIFDAFSAGSKLTILWDELAHDLLELSISRAYPMYLSGAGSTNIKGIPQHFWIICKSDPTRFEREEVI